MPNPSEEARKEEEKPKVIQVFHASYDRPDFYSVLLDNGEMWRTFPKYVGHGKGDGGNDIGQKKVWERVDGPPL